MTTQPGIYKILCIINNKVYIGYSHNVKKRKGKHINNLRANRHPNSHLQLAWNKYGEESFEFSQIELCSPSDLGERENYWCKEYNSHDREFGYNIEPTKGTTSPGRSEETKRKLSIANTGKKLPPEQIEKIKIARSVQIITKEHKEAISRGNKGKTISEEHKIRISIANKENGKRYTNENLRVPVIQKDKEGNTIKRWESMAEAHNTGLFKAPKISQCCKGTRLHHRECKWEYEQVTIKN